jgi:hypothetical protein
MHFQTIQGPQIDDGHKQVSVWFRATLHGVFNYIKKRHIERWEAVYICFLEFLYFVGDILIVILFALLIVSRLSYFPNSQWE